ncbi:uncharacterized protein [Dermacentor albipictus]|uniref:uncharacterized protein isoform X2 n=1 Tax=Dermacentor albipictus TaxID=60249 RepID=UPI0031FD0957
MLRILKEVLFIFAANYLLGSEYSVAALKIDGSTPLKSAVEGVSSVVSKAASALTNTFLPSQRHRIVTDVKFGGHKFAEIFEDKNDAGSLTCNLLGNRILIEHLLKFIPSALVTDVTMEEMEVFVDKCVDREPETKRSSLLDLLGTTLQSLLIYPGTKWCGAGDIANGYDDLGRAKEIDMCCRDHDHADDKILAFQTKHGIKNFMFYTMETSISRETSTGRHLGVYFTPQLPKPSSRHLSVYFTPQLPKQLRGCSECSLVGA